MPSPGGQEGRQCLVTDSVEEEVLARYAAASVRPEARLCCPSGASDPEALALLPREIIDVDYGCGDPTAWARPGDTVLDLGSGSGKGCYLLAAKVGGTGRVIGVDFNDAMLALARRHADGVAEKLGYRNVRFGKARVQDLALDLEFQDDLLAREPIRDSESLRTFEAKLRDHRRDAPLVASDSIDLVVSNCVLNLVHPEVKETPFQEMYRVLKRGGRAVISDIVCDEDPTPEILNDATLWSGCIAGAIREDRFLEAFESAGFHGIEIVSRSDEPWQVIHGIEFRSVTVRAYKGKEGPCLERNQAVLYHGPWRSVEDDDGHRFHRGRRVAVCDKTYRLLTDPNGPYGRYVTAVPPRVEIPLEEAGPFDCRRTEERSPRESKGENYNATVTPDASECTAGSCC